jgi:hypothetical protein
VIKEPKKLKNNMGIIKEDAFEDVATINKEKILNNLDGYNTPTVKYFLNLYAKGKTVDELDPKTDFVLINKIFNTLGLKERIDNILNEILTEKLCPKGEAYRQRRLAAGEKSSAYLSGRGIKVCKGLMSGKKKKK